MSVLDFFPHLLGFITVFFYLLLGDGNKMVDFSGNVMCVTLKICSMFSYLQVLEEQLSFLGLLSTNDIISKIE